MAESKGKTRRKEASPPSALPAPLSTTTRKLPKPANRSGSKSKSRTIPRSALSTRLGDTSAAARLLVRLEKPAKLTSRQQRQLLAALCKLIGYQVTGGIEPGHDEAIASDAPLVPSLLAAKLSPRQSQTLQALLKGDSEKQIARKLKLSPHTVHVYVKAIYRRFEVASRGELLARFVQH